MRVSNFHKEIAKLIAQGMPNREIMKQVSICGSRLSVLKANPLMQREIERYRKLEEDKYVKALKVFEDEAENVAKEIVSVAKKSTIDKTKLDAGLAVLDKLAAARGDVGTGQHGEEVVFEQMLRVTKRSQGVYDDADVESDGFDPGRAYEELERDLRPAVEKAINITPKPTFARMVKESLKNDPMPALGDNGDKKQYDISPALKRMLGVH
uniref:Uncharacterized protein n=1 Tax=viral metagenome TaxID=1070528 RepID=A0A6M3IMC1_9ZZZZ